MSALCVSEPSLARPGWDHEQGWRHRQMKKDIRCSRRTDCTAERTFVQRLMPGGVGVHLVALVDPANARSIAAPQCPFRLASGKQAPLARAGNRLETDSGANMGVVGGMAPCIITGLLRLKGEVAACKRVVVVCVRGVQGGGQRSSSTRIGNAFGRVRFRAIFRCDFDVDLTQKRILLTKHHCHAGRRDPSSDFSRRSGSYEPLTCRLPRAPHCSCRSKQTSESNNMAPRKKNPAIKSSGTTSSKASPLPDWVKGGGPKPPPSYTKAAKTAATSATVQR